jgi:endo-1,4-beta-xylanase
MKRNFILLFIAVSLLTGCTGSKKSNSSSAATSLREAYKDDFLIGTALSGEQIEEKDPNAAALVPKEFNAITPENIMKAEIIHPEWNRYNFDLADKIAGYGKKYNMKVNGHTLIWHSQLPAFVRNMKDADSVKQFFTDHITTIASRYDGKIASWDVVNEALEEDGS